VIRDRARTSARYVVAVAAVAMATLVVAVLAPLGRSSQPLIYLVAVLLVAVVAGRAAAILASVLAILAFDFFFVEPRFTFTVADPSEWVALVTFLVVAVVTSQLAAAVRDRADAAERREREARLLHDLADLMAITPLSAALAAACGRLSTELTADGVGILVDDGDRGGRLSAGNAEAVKALRGTQAAVEVLTQGASATAGAGGAAGRLIRVSAPHGARSLREGARLIRVPIRRGPRTLGQMAILPGARDPLADFETRLLDTAADQIALAVEREQLRHDALEAEVLRRTDELKSALLDAVSHDLRTPLASIIGSAGSLRQADVSWSAAEREDFARTIEQEAERLNRIVGNLLDLSRIQGGTLRPARAWHDPALVLRDAAERLRTGRADARITIDVPDDLAPAFIDPVEVDQVVANLVENALKYAGEVSISARDGDGTLEVVVEDSGPGIPSASLPRLFEPFYRAPGADAVRGSGLGLAVARGLVQAHGGRIRAENRPEGGARFVFSIPSPPRPETEEPA
jgi:two-component system sensor histidine kinase KdpD